MSDFDATSGPEKLAQMRKKVDSITDSIVSNFFERQKLMKEIANVKNQKGDEQPIFQHQREVDLINKYVRNAKKEGINPEMVELLVWELMSFGKSEQAEILNRDVYLDTSAVPSDVLKQHLEDLTDKVAKKDYRNYGKNWDATQHIILREKESVKQIIEEMEANDESLDLAIDLGCADGVATEKIVGKFKKIIGYDISQLLLDSAKERYPTADFIKHDLEKGIPVADNSADFILSNLGSASEVSSEIFKEISRVLKPNGKAFLSFYNKDAIITKWWRHWTNAFCIMINPHNDTVDVEVDGRVYRIKAIATNAQEINQKVLDNDLRVVEMSGSNHFWDFCPKSIFQSKNVVKAIIENEEITEKIPPFLGQYVRVIVERKV